MKITAENISDITKLGTILGVWAHPDDETFSMGGLMALARDNGQRVVCITATKGEQGSADKKRWPLENISQIRDQELSNALSELGVTEHHWLGYRDGECEKVAEAEAVDTIAGYIQDVDPDTVITFPPEGITGHPDHKCISRWTKKAHELLGHASQLYFTVGTKEGYDKHTKEMDREFNVYFAIDKPILYEQNELDLIVELPKNAADKKVRALKQQKSQLQPLFERFGDDFLTRSNSKETFIKPENAKLS